MTPILFEIGAFGCKVNQADARALADRLVAAGMCEAPRGAEPDLVVIQSCAVTGEAARQCRQAARRALRLGRRVAIVGCYAHEEAADPALGRMQGLLHVGPDPDALLEAVRRTWPELAEATGATGGLAQTPGRSRAMLKVQDGCPAACTYCIVRIVRPNPQSLEPSAAVEQARRLVEAGYREIVLCGIHLGLYGADLAAGGHSPTHPPDLASLVERLLAEVPDLGRVRLSSLEPMEVTDRLIELMASEPRRICPHLHLPLQSGDDAVLRRMGRPYRVGDYLDVVDRIRERLPGPPPAVTTDVLVGFPAETAEAFERTLAACRTAGFSRLHVFPFSPRPGTPAAGMTDQVPRDVARGRRAEAAALGESLAEAYRASLVGEAADVAVDAVASGGFTGLSERYVRVTVHEPPPPGLSRREIVRVVLTAAERTGLVGRVA